MAPFLPSQATNVACLPALSLAPRALLEGSRRREPEKMSVRLSPVRRGIAPILLFTLLLVAAMSLRLQAQAPDPAHHWTGGTTLLAPLQDGSPGSGLASPFANAMSADMQSGGDSTSSAISADGRFVAFVSTSYDLVAGIVHNGQLLLRDRDLDGNGIFDEPGNVRTTVVSVADDGSYAESGCWPAIDMTPDGRFVAFASYAGNLVPNDTNGRSTTMTLSAAPTGNVLFEIDGVSATTAALSASGRNGIATLRTSTLARGQHRVTVTCLGDSTYAGSTATVTYVVN